MDKITKIILFLMFVLVLMVVYNLIKDYENTMKLIELGKPLYCTNECR